MLSLGSLIPAPVQNFRFAVCFLKMPVPLNFQFQKVSGLSVSIDIGKSKNSGLVDGDDLFVEKVNNNDITFERGLLPLSSGMTSDFKKSVEEQIFTPVSVLICVLNNMCIPVNSWILYNAFVYDWSLSDFDATGNDVVIQTIKVKYKKLEAIGL